MAEAEGLSPEEQAILARMRQKTAEREKLLAEGKGHPVPHPDKFAGPVGFPPEGGDSPQARGSGRAARTL